MPSARAARQRKELRRLAGGSHAVEAYNLVGMRNLLEGSRTTMHAVPVGDLRSNRDTCHVHVPEGESVLR